VHQKASATKPHDIQIASAQSVDQPVQTNIGKARRNETVKCPTCGFKLLRKKLKQHKQRLHPPLPKLFILDKATRKSTQIRACASCGEQKAATWHFERTTRGPITLCLACKTRILKLSFSAEVIEKRRIDALKGTLKELRERKEKLPKNITDLNLINNIFELQNAIERGPSFKNSWSPILSGSFEGGKCR
jgi:DNA-directed RNA polymerase subunit RPC12/RpoP